MPPRTSDGRASAIHEVAKHTIGFSGADLANLINQAALIAVRDAQEKVVLENVLRARNVMLMGEERRSTMACSFSATPDAGRRASMTAG